MQQKFKFKTRICRKGKLLREIKTNDFSVQDSLVFLVSIEKPKECLTYKKLKTNRPWWKFWFPKHVYSYTVIKNNEFNNE